MQRLINIKPHSNRGGGADILLPIFDVKECHNSKPFKK